MADESQHDREVAEQLAKLPEQQKANYQAHMAIWHDLGYKPRPDAQVQLIKALARPGGNARANDISNIESRLYIEAHNARIKEQQDAKQKRQQQPAPSDPQQALPPVRQTPYTDAGGMVPQQQAARDYLKELEERRRRLNPAGGAAIAPVPERDIRPGLGRRPDYTELHETHKRVTDDTERRAQNFLDKRLREQERPQERSTQSLGDPDAVARAQDQLQKDDRRQDLQREHTTDAPAEKLQEIKAAKTELQKRSWSERYETTREERQAVEKSQKMGQSKGLGQGR